MAIPSLEERISTLEAEVACLKQRLEADVTSPWWEHRFGAFRDDPVYDEVARLGAEYRQAQPAPADADVRA